MFSWELQNIQVALKIIYIFINIFLIYLIPAPEVLNNNITKSIDYWSLGILLYELLIGIPPFYH